MQREYMTGTQEIKTIGLFEHSQRNAEQITGCWFAGLLYTLETFLVKRIEETTAKMSRCERSGGHDFLSICGSIE